MLHTCTKVTLRQREITNGRISLYLDYYPAVRHPETMIMSRREYLGIYIYARPKNEMEREFNNDMLMKAEAIRCIRVQSLINEEFGFLDKNKMRADFLEYFKNKNERNLCASNQSSGRGRNKTCSVARSDFSNRNGRLERIRRHGSEIP